LTLRDNQICNDEKTACVIVSLRQLSSGRDRFKAILFVAAFPSRLSRYTFSPAASPKALKAIRGTIRSWSLHLRSDKALDDLARMFNSHIRGWVNYYGRFCPSALYPTLWNIERYLARWVCGKYKSLRRHKRRSRHWLARIAQRQPQLFAHWTLLHGHGRTMGAG